MKWIKLYTEILDDPKIQRLQHRTRWFAVSCFLVAGEEEKDGWIGTPDNLAWRLRESIDDVTYDVDVLVDQGILEFDDDGENLRVARYADRQSDNTGKIRQAAKREKDKTKDVSRDGDVTVTNVSRDSNALEQTRLEERRLEERRQEKGASPFLISDTSPVAKADVVTTTAEISHQHEVISVWKEILHRYPPKIRWHEIVWVVQGQTIALRKLLTVWKSKKWNPTDVDAILERFRMSQAAEIDLMVAQEKKLNEAITLDQMIRRQMHANGRN